MNPNLKNTVILMVLTALNCQVSQAFFAYLTQYSRIASKRLANRQLDGLKLFSYFLT